MSSELYYKSLPKRLKLLDSQKAEREFKKWCYNYTIHSKAIHQYSPEIHILLLKYSIYYLHTLSNTHPELSQKIKSFISENDIDQEKMEKTSANFDPDKYCIFEDFTIFIEKSYESVENEYKEKIINIKEFSDYAQIIAVFKLICDLIDLVEIWKEKDIGLKKFQNLCKFRVVQVIRAKKAYENSPEGKEYENEIKKLNEQIKQDKINEEKRKKELIEQQNKKKAMLTKTFTISNTSLKNNLNPYKDIMLNNPPPSNLKVTANNNILARNNNYGLVNPFENSKNNIYSSSKESSIANRVFKRKVVYSQNDKEAQEINQMYMNYDPGEYEKVSNDNNTNVSNYFQINEPMNLQITKDNIDEMMKKVLRGYQYPGSKEINIGEIPVLFKSTDYYKLRLHIKSILIPKIISQLNSNNAIEAYNNCKVLAYYLSIMNSK